MKAIASVALGVVGLLYLTRTNQPKWYSDTMLRAFAADQLANPGTTKASQQAFENAANIAARLNLPIKWVLTLANKTTPDQLLKASEKVRDRVLKMGAPRDTQAATLQDYRKKALECSP